MLENVTRGCGWLAGDKLTPSGSWLSRRLLDYLALGHLNNLTATDEMLRLLQYCAHLLNYLSRVIELLHQLDSLLQRLAGQPRLDNPRHQFLAWLLTGLLLV